ncbi:MAG: AI-2E family transporter, partial [Bacteroidaceae bacterium]|nr:AI-2E family transporter [Bacteroidaceae bacterium]
MQKANENAEHAPQLEHHSILDERITFDRFVRGLLLVGCAAGIYLLLDMLSGVLWPFFVAWLLAYMMYPMVLFLELKCHIRYRLLSILAALLLVSGVVTALVVLTVPPAVQQIACLYDDLMLYATTYFAGTDVPQRIEAFFAQNFDQNDIIRFFQNDDVIDAVSAALTHSWSLFSETMNIVWEIVSFMIVLLYLFFFLMDYEKVNQNWIRVIPRDQRPMAGQIAAAIKREMNSYFRGQATVAFIVGVLFSIGFLIIDFPMAIGLGMFIGLLNMVPYAQLLGFIPTILLALLKANDTGGSFWLIFL